MPQLLIRLAIDLSAGNDMFILLACRYGKIVVYTNIVHRWTPEYL